MASRQKIFTKEKTEEPTKKQPYEPAKVEVVHGEQARVEALEKIAMDAVKRETEAAAKEATQPKQSKSTTLDDILSSLDDLKDSTLESYGKINRKMTEFDMEFQGTQKSVKRLIKKVSELEDRVTALEGGGVIIHGGSTASVSLLEFTPTRDYSGNSLACMAHDVDNHLYPIKDERIARFYDENFLVAPVEVEHGLVRRVLTVKEASEHGC